MKGSKGLILVKGRGAWYFTSNNVHPNKDQKHVAIANKSMREIDWEA